MNIEKYLEAEILRHVVEECEHIKSVIEDNTPLINIMGLLQKDDNIKVRFIKWLNDEEKIAEYEFSLLLTIVKLNFSYKRSYYYIK